MGRGAGPHGRGPAGVSQYRLAGPSGGIRANAGPVAAGVAIAQGIDDDGRLGET